MPSEMKRGGAYSILVKIRDSAYENAHHMPAKMSSPLPKQDGPAIIMRIEDHRETGSFDNRKGAKGYRLKQRELIQSGKFFEAFMMDVEVIRSRCGSRYDSEIQAAEEYLRELIERGEIR